MKDILNFHQATENIGTGGQPTPDQLSEVAAANYSVVVNVAMHDSDGAIPEEGSIVASLGMQYIHIPVPFAAPSAEHLKAFFKVMDAFETEKIFVHCAVNARVSAFVYKYLTLKKGMSSERATSPLLKKWLPVMDSHWQSILDLKADSLK